MKLLEILSTKFSDVHVIADNDEEYEVEAKIGERTIRFLANTMRDDDKTWWEVEFTEDHDELKSHTHKLTGSGREFEVFAFIKQCMETLIKKYHPKVIKFTADKEGSESRAAVYEKMIKRYLKGYKLRVMDDGSRQVKFTLEVIR